MNLFTSKPGIETVASKECLSAGIKIQQFQKGLLIAENDLNVNEYDFCFSSWQFFQFQKIVFKNYNCGIRNAVDWYCDSIRSENIHSHWPLLYLTFSENGFVPDSSKSKLVFDNLRKKVSRVAKLAKSEYPSMNTSLSGFFIIETDTRSLCLSKNARFYGQKRMRHDPQAPSRSYLKIEEAFSIFGKEPLAGEFVIDLGAAPGGWSYAASKRGATVLAIDNGPLKKGAANSNLIKHIPEDAFLYKPEKPVDWLFCDMVEDPYRVIKLIRTWVKNRWCRYAIINCKYGFANPFQILTLIKSPEGFLNLAEKIICKHLFHDRDELTVMLEIQ